MKPSSKLWTERRGIRGLASPHLDLVLLQGGGQGVAPLHLLVQVLAVGLRLGRRAVALAHRRGQLLPQRRRPLAWDRPISHTLARGLRAWV